MASRGRSYRKLVLQVWEQLRDQGFTHSDVSKAIDVVLKAWKTELQHGRPVEVPLGKLDVVPMSVRRKHRAVLQDFFNPATLRIVTRNRQPLRIRFRSDRAVVDKELN